MDSGNEANLKRERDRLVAEKIRETLADYRRQGIKPNRQVFSNLSQVTIAPPERQQTWPKVPKYRQYYGTQGYKNLNRLAIVGALLGGVIMASSIYFNHNYSISLFTKFFGVPDKDRIKREALEGKEKFFSPTVFTVPSTEADEDYRMNPISGLSDKPTRPGHAKIL